MEVIGQHTIHHASECETTVTVHRVTPESHVGGGTVLLEHAYIGAETHSVQTMCISTEAALAMLKILESEQVPA